MSVGKQVGGAVAVVVAAALLVGVGVVVANDGSAALAEQSASFEVDQAAKAEAWESDLAAKTAAWEIDLAAANTRADEAEQRADQAEDTARREMQAELDERADELEVEASEQLADEIEALTVRDGELDDREAALDDRDGELDAREMAIAEDLARLERVSQSTFGDGTWEVGVDIEPGRYRTDPGDGCYWARLRQRGGAVGSIIDNNNARGSQEIVVIGVSDAYFESKRCGTWTPID